MVSYYFLLNQDLSLYMVPDLNCYDHSIRSTLKFQESWTYDAQITNLKPKRVTVAQDGQPNKSVNFHGCKIIQLRSTDSYEKDGVMPFFLTIGGRCTYTKEDKRDFEIMMRTKQESYAMHLPPNGEYDWPNYKAFETCPFCCKRAKPGASDTYWMLFQNLMQKTSDGIGMRFQCRLTCEDCFERFTEGQYLQCSVGGGYLQGVPLLDVVENQGPVTWLRDGQGISAQCTKSQTTLNAYMLYSMWEYCGAWAAMSDQFCDVLKGCRTFSQGIMLRNEPRPDDPDSYWEMSDIPTEKGRECDGPGCNNVHGDRAEPREGEAKGKKIRLEHCTGCFEAMYCSKKCHKAAWTEHKIICQEIQRVRKEKEEKEQAEKEAAILASFVPTSPQGGEGYKKKKGKRGGRKKKGRK